MAALWQMPLHVLGRCDPTPALRLTLRAEPLKLSTYLPQLTARLEVFLGCWLRRSTFAVLLALLRAVSRAEGHPKVTLDTSETLFTDPGLDQCLRIRPGIERL